MERFAFGVGIFLLCFFSFVQESGAGTAFGEQQVIVQAETDGAKAVLSQEAP